MNLIDEYVNQIQVAMDAMRKARGALISAEVEMSRLGPATIRLDGIWDLMNKSDERLEANLKWWKRKLETGI